MTMQAPADRVALLEFLLKKGADLNAKDELGKNLLCKCAVENSGKTAAFLIEKGIEFKVKNVFGRTALHYAAIYDEDKMFASLIKLDTDNFAKDLMGYTPLHLAAINGSRKVISLILKNYNSEIELSTAPATSPSALNSTATSPSKATSSSLSKLLAEKDHQKRTPADLAAYFKQKHLVEMLRP